MTLSAQQTEIRRRSLGSTDSAAVLGFYHPELAWLSTYKNAGDVFLRLVHGIDLPKNASMGRGIKVEPLIRTLYRETIGPLDDPPGTLRHPEHEWMVGSPDGVTAGELVEFKTVGRWSAHKWGPEGTDKIPDSYSIQTQHLMAITDRDRAVVLAAFGNDIPPTGPDDEPEFEVEKTALYVVNRNDEVIEEIIKCGARFMREHVDARVSPCKPLKNIRAWQKLVNQ